MVQNWNQKEINYDLGDGYTLTKAEKETFVKYAIIYSSINLWLFNDFTGSTKQLSNEVNKDINSLFWIHLNNKRVGGILISPNTLSNPFFIPPFENKYIVFDKLNKALSVWSNQDQQITVYGITENERKIFISLGFKVKSERCAMIRPTDSLNVVFEKDIKIINISETCNVETINKLAHFFCEAHQGSADDKGTSDEAIRNKQDMLQYFFKMFAENNTLDCSCYLTDNDKIIGACIVGKDDDQQDGYAGIVDVAVLPQYRGKGFASKMINYSTTKASKYSPAIYLGVTIGNDAQNLYTKLGFVSGMIFTHLYR